MVKNRRKVLVKKFKFTDSNGKDRYDFKNVDENKYSKYLSRGWQDATQKEWDKEEELKKNDPPPKRRWRIG